MNTELEHMLGGALRPGDPRRFLIEAMVGAMNSDGYVDPRELDVLHRHLAEHELFAKLPSETARVLIELATDAVGLAGEGRVEAIARGLPARIHRLAAFAMACEICVADQHIHEAEIAYMQTLSGALGLARHEAEDLFEGARQDRPMETLVGKIDRLTQLVPRVVDCLALAHCLERRVRGKHKKQLHKILCGLIDVKASPQVIEREIARALDPIEHSQDVSYGLQRLARRVPEATDRYWLAVYVAADYVARGHGDLCEVRFFSLLERAFAIASMSAVIEHARLLAAA